MPRLILALILGVALAGAAASAAPSQPPANRDPFADAVDSADTSIIAPEYATGAPDGNPAIITGAPFNSSGSAIYDMGAAEQGTGGAILHYVGTDLATPLAVAYLDANHVVLQTITTTIPPAASGGVYQFPVFYGYSGIERPWRFLYIQVDSGRGLFLDAIEAANYQGKPDLYLPLISR